MPYEFCSVAVCKCDIVFCCFATKIVIFDGSTLLKSRW